MSFWVAGAVVVAAVVGHQSAKDASGKAAASARTSLEFSKAQYADWLDAFGDVQANLSDYYENLTPAYLETQGLQAFEREKTIALTGLRENLEQRGIATSGLAVDAETDIALQSATARASIRAEAPLRAAQEQSNFLQIGLGQNPADNLQNTLNTQARTSEAQAVQARADSAKATGAAIDTTFDVLSEQFSAKPDTTSGEG